MEKHQARLNLNPTQHIRFSVSGIMYVNIGGQLFKVKDGLSEEEVDREIAQLIEKQESNK